MEKKIQCYLHLYFGCECYCTNKTASKDVIYILRSVGALFCEVSSEAEERTFRCSAEQVKPILRPLSDMTEEEIKELDATKVFVRATPVHMVGNMQWTAESYRWMLSKGFDLFGLIESSLAIDKTKLPAHA